MAQYTQQDEIDQLLLQPADTSMRPAFTAGAPSDNKMKEKLIHVVVSGRSRRYLGKPFTTKEIETLDQEQIQKLYARYEVVLGGLITKQLKRHMCFAYSRACKLYHEYGYMLAPLEAAIITSSHVSRTTDQAQAQTQTQAQTQAEHQDQAEDS